MGGEASWAGAGMLAPGGEVETRDIWTDLALESLRMYPEFVAQLEAESGVSIDYRRCGAVEVAFDGAEYQALTRRAEFQRPLGIPSLVLDDSELRKLVPLFDRESAGALFYAGDAIVDPRDIMRALRTACCTTGVEIREGWRAARIKLSTDSVQVENERGDAAPRGHRCPRGRRLVERDRRIGHHPSAVAARISRQGALDRLQLLAADAGPDSCAVATRIFCNGRTDSPSRALHPNMWASTAR